MSKIFVVCVDRGRDESDVSLIKAFTNQSDAEQHKDKLEMNLTSQQSHVFYFIEEIELVEAHAYTV